MTPKATVGADGRPEAVESAASPDGHYFDHGSGRRRSRPAHVRLDLPDVSFDAAAPTGACSRPAGSTRAPRCCCSRRPLPPPVRRPARPRLRLRADRADAGARRPGATVWAVDVNERALALTEANAAAAGLANVRVADPDEVPRRRPLAAPSGRTRRCASARPRSTTCWPAGWAGSADDGRALLVVQKHLGVRLARTAGWSSRAGRSPGGPAAWRTGCSTSPPP